MRRVPTVMEGMYLLDKKPTPAMASLVIHNNFSNRVYRDGSFKFLPYQLSMVGLYPTIES